VTLAIGATASEDGQECRIVATDISERKREQEILSIRLQLQQFAVSHSRKDLLRRALDEVERITGGQLGACYLLAQGSLVREAWSTSTRRTFSDAADAEPVASSLVQSGAWADSATQCHPIVHNDPAWPLSKVGLPELDAEVSPEVSRILVVPILRNEEVVALVGVANKCTDFTPDDVKTVDHLMDVAWSIAEQKKAVEDQKYLQLRLQLVESQKMEAIGTLAGGIAHDFNNILAGILGGLTLIDLDLGATDEKKASVQEMMGLVRRGSDLTRQLLGFARRGKYDIRRLDLARVVTKTSAMFGRTRKELTIRLDFPPGLRAVLMDRTQLEQVLLNLFVNAAHAMPGGGVLSVSAENQEATKDATKDGTKEGTNPPADGAGTGNFVKLVVRDTGTGMDAATQARIFEPFFTTKGPGQGTGLGLASVYGIVKSHEGFITVKSAPGQGTAFSVYLPATDQPSNEDRTPAVVIERGAGTIMIVDDEPPVLDMLTRLLKKIGYQVLSASSGHAAVELVRQYGKAISLVILDMIMPEMSGSQTYDALREVRPDLKVLVSSGYSMEEQARDMLGRGCRGFIQKPFDIAALSSTLRALV
jgi:signal transduction histidine kinase/CheY-like chemotaxis protein